MQALADASTDDAGFSKALQAVETALQEVERTMADRNRVARSL